MENKQIKKVITLLAVLFITVISYAQTVIQTNLAETSHFNLYTNKWDVTNKKYANITFVLKGYYLYTDDDANSIYYLYKLISSDGNSHSYEATDELNRRCRVSILRYGTNGAIMVMYKSTTFTYYFNP
jgi:hypothetical protein